MKRVVVWAAIAIAFGIVTGAFAQMPRDAAIAKTERLLENLKAGKTAEIVKELDSKVAQALPESKLREVWPGVIGQFGAFKGVDERREGQYQGRQAVELILAFEKETIVMRMVYDADGKVSGLVFRPKDMAVLPSKK
jgi:hypothetical protein